MLDEGQTEKTIAREIFSILSKIRDEFDDIKKAAFSQAEVNIYVCVEAIEVITQNSKLQEAINREQAIISMPVVEDKEQKFNEELQDEKKKNNYNQYPLIIDVELSKYLDEEVRERQLLQFGHFVLNEEYCARDWLNIRELVETREISKKIVSSIVKHINSRHLKNVVILGMDMVGALLAARVAFELKFPMSYFVSVKNTELNATQEIDFEIKPDEEVIIITESIATFKTLTSALNRYNLYKKVDSIYTIFYRKTPFDLKENNELLKKTYSVNSSFPIELVKKSKCSYKANNCFAKNKH